MGMALRRPKGGKILLRGAEEMLTPEEEGNVATVQDALKMMVGSTSQEAQPQKMERQGNLPPHPRPPRLWREYGPASKYLDFSPVKMISDV